MATYETLLYEAGDDGIARLTLNRPHAMNGINGEMAAELHAAVREIAGDRGVRVLILTGAGKAFCPGADLNQVGGDAKALPGAAAEHFQVSAILHEMPAVTIAAINGACAGAGMSFAAACDLRLATRSAVFRTAFLNVGVAGDFGLAWTLPRLVGPAKARELLFLPDRFTADEAERIGLVSRVWDDDRFAQEVAAIAGRIAGAAPLALEVMKEHLVSAERMVFADFLKMEGPKIRQFFQTDDAREAVRAFMEKREPRFTGS